MAERPEVPNRLMFDMNPRGKKGKALESALAIGTVSSVSIVMPQAVEKTISAPTSPIREEKRSRGFLKHLPRPKSPNHRRKHSHSDPERTPSPQPSSNRPRWLGLRKHGKKKNDVNGATTPIPAEGASPSPSGSASSLEQPTEVTQSFTVTIPPSATSVDQLPGALRKADSRSSIPVIMVSSHSGECDEEPLRTSGSSVSFEDMNGGGDPLDTTAAIAMTRKLSQSSQKSACSSTLQSVGTSGVGSLLSPSGDESYANSDLESPMSPLSRTSSFTTEEEEVAHHSDTDPIDADLHPSLTSPVSDPEMMQASMPTKDSPLEVSPTTSSKKELRKQKKKKKDKVWNNFYAFLLGCVNIFVGVYLCWCVIHT